MDPIAALKNFPRPPRRAVTGGMAALALGGIAYAAAALTSRLMREALRYRRDANALYRRWTTIPAIAGPGVLRIHSRVRDVMTHRAPIVLVHGYGIGSSYFVPLAARLSRHAPVFAPDLPGHGPSDHDARPLDVPELAQALGEWMERMGLKGAAIVAHSLGCQVAIHLAARRPELASRLLLIAPTADAAARTALDVPRDEVRSMLEDRPENLIGRLRCPVAIVRGERDRIVSQRWAEELARRAGASEPIVVPGWGHAVHYDDPEAVAAIVLRHGIENGRERRATPR